MAAGTTHYHDYRQQYIDELGSVLDLDLIRNSGIHIGADPLGGAGVHYWQPIADKYKLNMTVVNKEVDPTFRFMTVDWDGQIRMDPSSPYAMAGLIGMKDRFDISVACDTDHDRHGIVTRSVGLLPPNHYLAVCINYLFQNRPGWGPERRRREDGGEQQHHRPGHRAAETKALRSAGGFQMVCRRIVGPVTGFCRRRKRGCFVPPQGRQRLDHG